MSASSSTREEEPLLKSTLVDAGIISPGTNVFFNLSSQELQDHSVRNNEGGMYTANGTYAIDTGKFTGRSPKDKYFVCQEPSSKNIWWGNVNRPITEEVFNELYELCVNHFRSLDKVYVYDGYCGASRTSQKSVRFITELAWMSHFVKNMFIDADFYGGICKGKGMEPGKNFLRDPDFTIINACKVVNHKWESQGLNSENFIAFNIERKIAVIGGTSYGGEMKKGMFSMMNYWLPLENVMTIHCSANKGFSSPSDGSSSGSDSNTALFFGLSGTGKTTLSTDPHRKLIGDDEIGWNSEGIFNLEGGCYAKTINLSEVNEPDIFRAIRPGALLENVEIDAETKIPDYYNVAKTENGRVSYPLSFIDNYETSGGGCHPKNIIFLTCDAFGIFPPISLLTSKQAIYYFLSGYTSKVAGTERGVTEPQAVFSSCFGEAFLTLHPSKYADLLSQKLDHFESINQKINVYLVNTGWIGGAYGVGKRMNIKDTRACIDAIFNGTIVPDALEVDPVFGISFPKYIVGNTVPPHVLNPRESWTDKAAYDEQRIKLAGMFINNYAKFIDVGFTDYSAYGPHLP